MILRFVIFGALLVLAIEAKRYSQFSEDEQWQEFEEYLKWKKAKEIRENGPPEIKYEKRHNENHDSYKMYGREQQVPVNSPPPIDQAALMARYIVNQADWASVATISSRKDIPSFPAVTLVSYTDGLLGNGSGVPYLYLTPLDFTAQDLAKDNRASLLMTLAQGDYCKNKKWDPMDPRCARILMSGKIKPLKNESMELEYAQKTFLKRHPGLANMPANHHFYFAKLKIITVVVLDTFGGPKYVSVKDYLHPPIDNVTDEFNRLFPVESYESRSQEEFGPVSNVLNPVVRSV
ncbi:Protein CREG1 [Habropoda laboriosa]|uniref:Protein CREG1 n=1 Tax=Habropoda laboriosa TaxID=597456 RepID=A0A0L7QQE8_9HYME|nr:PREDICTED: protein CREG1 [Habropoda laboriosa]KOC60746.1 Protein CREG1 [Habropoda laboriosa]